MGEPTNASWVRDAVKNGLLTPEQVGEAKRKGKPAPLIRPAFRPGVGRAEWVVPVETRAEANQRSWRARSRRSDAAWRAVSRAFGPELRTVARFAEAFHAGKAVRVELVRLGGRALDRHDNLPSALKGCADAVCFLIGADDRTPLIRWEYGQLPGGPMGVRIVLRVGGEDR